MAPRPKPAVYKDAVTAELALRVRAHSFIADEYLQDTTLAQPGKKVGGIRKN